MNCKPITFTKNSFFVFFGKYLFKTIIKKKKKWTYDDIRKMDVLLTPEEMVRQKVIQFLLEEIKEHKKAIKELYKATNLGMIKYHQIKNLLEVREQYGIQAFIAITFFKSTNTYAVPIEDFVEHWKQMDKKSVNEDDLDDLVEQGKAFNLEQEYIRKTMRSTYNVSQLVK